MLLEKLGEPTSILCASFVAKAKRIDETRYALEQRKLGAPHVTYVVRAPRRRSSQLGVNIHRVTCVHATHVTLAAIELGVDIKAIDPASDPADPRHERLATHLGTVKEGLVDLLEPHLSFKSIGELDVLFDFWCSYEVLETFCTSEQLADERAAIIQSMLVGDG